MSSESCSSRNAILNRLRLHSNRDENRTEKPSPRGIHTQAQRVSHEGLEHFISKLQENRIEVLQSSQQDWPHDLLKFSTENQLKSWLLGEREEAQRFQKCLVGADNIDITVFDRNYEQIKDQLFLGIESSLSFAHAGIISTGSLVVQSSSSEPRMLSLVAPTSVIICPTDNLISDLNEYMNLLDKQSLVNSSNTIVISSPSKTADIQQQLAYGAHGPKRVIALLI